MRRSTAPIAALPFLALLTLLCTLPAASHAQPPGPDCMRTAMTQSALTDCAVSFAEAADARLNKAYRDVMCHLAPEEKAGLVASQRVWLQFRDADCAFWGGGGGSIAPMNQQFCIADLSATRADELDRWPPNSPRSALTPCE